MTNGVKGFSSSRRRTTSTSLQTTLPAPPPHHFALYFKLPVLGKKHIWSQALVESLVSSHPSAEGRGARPALAALHGTLYAMYGLLCGCLKPSRAWLGFSSPQPQHPRAPGLSSRGQDFCTFLTFLGLPAPVQPATTHHNSSISTRIHSCASQITQENKNKKK